MERQKVVLPSWVLKFSSSSSSLSLALLTMCTQQAQSYFCPPTPTPFSSPPPSRPPSPRSKPQPNHASSCSTFGTLAWSVLPLWPRTHKPRVLSVPSEASTPTRSTVPWSWWRRRWSRSVSASPTTGTQPPRSTPVPGRFRLPGLLPLRVRQPGLGGYGHPRPAELHQWAEGLAVVVLFCFVLTLLFVLLLVMLFLSMFLLPMLLVLIFFFFFFFFFSQWGCVAQKTKYYISSSIIYR